MADKSIKLEKNSKSYYDLWVESQDGLVCLELTPQELDELYEHLAKVYIRESQGFEMEVS